MGAQPHGRQATNASAADITSVADSREALNTTALTYIPALLELCLEADLKVASSAQPRQLPGN